MNRRQLITGAAAATVSAAATTAVHARDRGRDMAVKGQKAMSSRLDSLEARFDKLEHHHKNLVRVGALAFTVSTGIDIFTVL